MTTAQAYRDPRMNAPPRICDLRGDELRRALFARADAHRERYMAQFERQQRLANAGPLARLASLFGRHPEAVTASKDEAVRIAIGSSHD